jgi:hypothetical protein
LIATGALLLGAAALLHSVSGPAAAACNTAPTADGTTSPVEGAQQSAPADLALVQAAGEGCLNCHADQEKVKALAVEEEPAESLSSGPG